MRLPGCSASRRRSGSKRGRKGMRFRNMAFATTIGRNLPVLQPQAGTRHKSLKSECIRPVTLLTLQDARRLIGLYVTRYKVGRAPSDSSRPRRTRCWRATSDSSRTQSQSRGRTPARCSKITAPITMRGTMILPGETAAGSAEMQPYREIAWWAHRDDHSSARISFPRSCQGVFNAR